MQIYLQGYSICLLYSANASKNERRTSNLLGSRSYPLPVFCKYTKRREQSEKACAFGDYRAAFSISLCGNLSCHVSVFRYTCEQHFSYFVYIFFVVRGLNPDIISGKSGHFTLLKRTFP